MGMKGPQDCCPPPDSFASEVLMDSYYWSLKTPQDFLSTPPLFAYTTLSWVSVLRNPKSSHCGNLERFRGGSVQGITPAEGNAAQAGLMAEGQASESLRVGQENWRRNVPQRIQKRMGLPSCLERWLENPTSGVLPVRGASAWGTALRL